MGDINFNLVIVIVFLVVGAIRWVIENLAGKKPPPEGEMWDETQFEESQNERQPPSSLKELYEDARREILERQNNPAPKAERNPVPQTQPAPPPLPGPVPGKARINRQEPAPAPEQKRVQRRPVTAQQAKAAAAFEQHSKKDKRAASVAASGSRARQLLASPTAARDAVILAEILAPPKSMR